MLGGQIVNGGREIVARVVDHRLDRAERLARPIGQALDIILARDVARKYFAAPALGEKFIARRLERRARSPDDHRRRAQFANGGGRRLADSRAAAGDDYRLAIHSQFRQHVPRLPSPRSTRVVFHAR